MKLHTGNFDHGVNWVNLGFLMDMHPNFGNLEAITNDIVQSIVNGWHHDDHYWNKDRRAAIQQIYDPDGKQVFKPSEFPIIVRTDNVTAQSKNGNQIRTYAVTVTTPAKFQRTGKMLLDYLFLTKRSLKNYIPMAFRTEDPNEFFELIKQHENWMTNHRNIQLRNVSTIEQFRTTISTVDNNTLENLISKIPEVINFQFDSQRQRVNVSVAVENYMTTIESLDKAIRTSQFEFPVFVKKPKQHTTSSPNSSTTGRFSYASALAFHKQERATKSVYTQNSHDDHSTSSKTSLRPWSQRPIPKTINFVDVNDFPFLRTKKNLPTDPERNDSSNATPAQFKPETHNRSTSPHPTHISHISDTLSSSTIEKTIAEAINEINKKYQKDLDELKAEIQDLKAINQTLQNIKLQQEEMDKKSQARSSGLEQRVTQLLAILDDQNIINRPAEPEFLRPRKKTIKGRQFNTPEKKSVTHSYSPNRYSTLEDDDENNEDSANVMDTDDEDATTVRGDMDDEDLDTTTNHPITDLRNPESDDENFLTLVDSNSNNPTTQPPQRIQGGSKPRIPSALRPRGRGFRREN